VDVHPADRAKNSLIIPTNDTDGDTADESTHHDEDEDDEDLMPADGELSPVDGLKKFDWADVDAEYKEFMADVSDDDDDDDEGGTDAGGPETDDADGEDTKAGSGTKRKHETDDEDETVSNADSSRGRPPTSSESLLAKKLRVSRERPASGLREVQTASAMEPNNTTDPDAVNSGLPTPQITGDEDEVALLPMGEVGGKSMDDTEEVDIDDEDLLAELEAEEAEES
jgi:RNA polymerase II subunit A C-terminal domain phosphatase